MKSAYTKIWLVIPEALIITIFGAMVAALWGLGVQAQAAMPEVGAKAQSALDASTSKSAFAPFAPLPEDLTVESDEKVVHLPQISEILDAAPQVDAIKIDLPQPDPVDMTPAQAPVPYTHRLEHAHELLGKFYNRSVVKSGEKVAQVGRFVQERTRKSLRPKFKRFSKAIADAVMRESNRHGFDPVFLMAVIENESSFNPYIVGSVGEIGLMQLTPATADWVSKKFNIKYRGKKSLRDPKTNIRLGAAYLSYLRDRFDSHSRLYLSAYNMGSQNVRRARARSVWPKDYASAVMKRYIRYYGDLKDEVAKPASPAMSKAEAAPKRKT